MNNEQQVTSLFDTVVQYYLAYIDRNETFAEFAYDVNTLGGTLELGVTHIDTTKTTSTVTDNDFKPIVRYPLKEIWNAVKGQQMSLF